MGGLSTFWPEDDYEGLSFEVRGFHNVCYNFHGQVNSVSLGKGTIVVLLPIYYSPHPH